MLTRYLEDDEKAKAPWNLSWRRIWVAFKRAILQLMTSEASLRCAGVAFYGFLSLFPSIAAAVIIFGLIADQNIINQLIAQAAPLLPQGPEELLRSRLHDLESKPAQGLGFGLLFTLAFAFWTGSRGTNAMMYALSRAYHESRERSFLHSAAVSIGLTIGTFVVAAAAIFAIAIIPVLLQVLQVSSYHEAITRLIRWPAIAGVIFITTSLLFRLAPNRRRAKWCWIAPGALFVSVLWLLTSLAFSIYVENFASYDLIFGPLTAAIVLMLWMYYSAVIFVFGAAINAELELATAEDTTVGPPKPMGQRGAYVADHVTGMGKGSGIVADIEA